MFCIDSINHPIYILADFLEFQALYNGKCALNDLRSLLSASEDELDINGIEEGDDKVLNKLQEALLYCSRRKKEFCNYPFVINEQSISLSLNINDKELVYLFLLLVNRMNMQQERIQGGKNATELFEHLCRLDALNYFGNHAKCEVFGTAVSGNFKDKVNSLLSKLNIRGVYKQPFGGTEHQKDGGVDIVTWIPFKDNKGSQLIALGQCKTGSNWEYLMKKVDFFDNFSTERPFVDPIYMFFVSEDFGTYKWEQYSRSCGILFDRKRVMELVPDNIKEVNSVLFSDIQLWVFATMDYIRNK